MKPRVPNDAQRQQILAAIAELRSNGHDGEADDLERMLNEGKILIDPRLPTNVVAQGPGDGKIYLNPRELLRGRAGDRWFRRQILASTLFDELVHIRQYRRQGV